MVLQVPAPMAWSALLPDANYTVSVTVTSRNGLSSTASVAFGVVDPAAATNVAPSVSIIRGGRTFK